MHLLMLFPSTSLVAAPAKPTARATTSTTLSETGTEGFPFHQRLMRHALRCMPCSGAAASYPVSCLTGTGITGIAMGCTADPCRDIDATAAACCCCCW